LPVPGRGPGEVGDLELDGADAGPGKRASRRGISAGAGGGTPVSGPGMMRRGPRRRAARPRRWTGVDRAGIGRAVAPPASAGEAWGRVRSLDLPPAVSR